MSTKVSIALTEAEDAELEAQARTTGKTKTALVGEHFRAGLSSGTSRTILDTELDPEELEYRQRRARNLAEETAQETSRGVDHAAIEAEAARRAQGEED